MSKDDLSLSGTGTAYIRVSTDQQDTERQYASIRAFETRHSVKIAPQYWFKDEGWARDEADKRPDFQRLMQLAATGAVQWIVVDALDRFGTKDAYQLVSYLYRLRECGCKLYDASGKEWTGADIATIITAVVEGEKSKGEQTSKSHRVQGGKVARARLGEWQGGFPRLGFDVACYHRETGKELWRVVYESRHKRLKVYPDGRTERFDGKGNFPKCQDVTEVLKIARSNDLAKIEAAVSVFHRYATESISFVALAHHLNKLGFRNSSGGMFQGQHVAEMLEDPIHLGYYTYNRWHSGKLHRFTGGQPVREDNYDKKFSKNARQDWVESPRLFDPLVDLPIWNAVQEKLKRRSKQSYAPRSASQYLGGLVYCGNCGRRMVSAATRKPAKRSRKDGTTGDRWEYYCGSYHKALQGGWPWEDGVRRQPHENGCRGGGQCKCEREECKCFRNSIYQYSLERYIEQFLDETGRRLEILSPLPDGKHLLDRQNREVASQVKALWEGFDRLTAYLTEHHPEQYNALLQEDAERRADEAKPGLPMPKGTLNRMYGKERMRRGVREASEKPIDFLPTGPLFRDCLDTYRELFDPSLVDAEIARLDAEHTATMERWAGLKPGSLARGKADEQLAKLDARITVLKHQRQHAGEAIDATCREIAALKEEVAKARKAMSNGAGERALRQRAEAIRGIIHRIDCTFTATGQTGRGWGKKNARLVKIEFHPVGGDARAFAVDSQSAIHRFSVTSLDRTISLSFLLRFTLLIGDSSTS